MLRSFLRIKIAKLPTIKAIKVTTPTNEIVGLIFNEYKKGEIIRAYRPAKGNTAQTNL